MTQPVILAFNLAPERAARIRAICAVQKLRFREIPRESFPRSVGELAGVLPPSEPAEAAADFDEELLVLCNLREAQLNAFLQGFRRSGLPSVALKAVLTPSNARWSPAQLCGELQKEREAFRNAQP